MATAALIIGILAFGLAFFNFIALLGVSAQLSKKDQVK